MNLIACRKAFPVTGGQRCRHIEKLLLIMKMTAILLLAIGLQVSAKGLAQDITLSEKKAPLKKVLQDLQRQSGYSFFFEDRLLEKSNPVTLTLQHSTLDKVLELIFRDQPLTYEKIGEKIIAIREKKIPPSTKIAAPLPAPAADTTITITGRVTNDSGAVMKGVTVSVAGGPGSGYAVTGDDGAYTIRVSAVHPTLIFSYVSYTNVVRTVGKERIINVILKPGESKLDDVVVVGYGTQRRKDLTGSVGSVKMEDLNKAPVRSFEEALAGRVAGVQVISSDGQPGSALNILIRGNNSLTQDNSPLFVIDGFPVENPDNNAINPADIESIDVLKDASATAIYGARGANGVVIITTKKGRSGPPVISLDAYAGFNDITRKQPLMNPYQFVGLMNEIYPAYTDTTYLGNATLDDYKKVKGIDWQDEVTNNHAPFQNYSLALRGGNNGTNYSLSLAGLDQKGIVVNSGFTRYQGRFVLDQKVKDNLKVGMNLNYAYSRSYGQVISQYGGNDRSNAFLSSVWGYRPLGGSAGDSLFSEENANLVNSDVDPAINTANDYRYNPLSTARNTLNDRYSNALLANIYLQYDITRDLSLRITGGIDRVSNKANVFYNSHTRQGDIRVGGTGPYGSVDSKDVNNYLNENTLTWHKRFNDQHQLDVLGGFTLQEQDATIYGFSSGTLPNESLGISGLDEGTPTADRSSMSNNTLASFLGRINYNYKSTYYFTASYRADGSSKFKPSNHWSYFPSGAVSWRLSNEKFMKSLSRVGDFKLRASYGITGNNRVTDFPYLSTITLPVATDYSFAGSYNNGAALATLGNKDLKWETTAQFDAGADIELFAGRIGLTADYYDKRTSHLLLNASLPGSTGYLSAFENIGQVKNGGWEFTLNTVIIRTKDFTWSSSFNISFNRSKVLSLVDGQESLLSSVAWSKNGYGAAPAYIAKVGQPVALMYGYIFDGLYQYKDFNQTSTGSYVLKAGIPNNGNTASTIKPGYVRYKDINGDGVVDSKDQTVIGRPYPLHTGGFSNNFSYKHFDLNLFFQWSYGNQIINANRYVFEGELALDRNMFASYANRWTPSHTNTQIPTAGGLGPYVYSSRVIEDGSYLRLKTAQLGYSLPDKLVKKMKMRTLRVYVSGQNLITWTRYSGQDPEVSAYYSALTPGFDYSTYPRARTITFGLNTTF